MTHASPIELESRSPGFHLQFKGKEFGIGDFYGGSGQNPSSSFLLHQSTVGHDASQSTMKIHLELLDSSAFAESVDSAEDGQWFFFITLLLCIIDIYCF